MPEIVAQRVFNPLYIYLDTAFLAALCVLLFCKRKYMTLLFGLFGGVLYFLVDYGIFHLWLGTRSIEGGSLFWVLLWMSMSYGITNFVLIWTWISKDRHTREWTLFILLWWFVCPLMAGTFGQGLAPVKIQRTTNAYHGWMAVILFASYAALIGWNLFHERADRFPILWLFVLGILVQFGWEASLLLGGIRSAGIAALGDKLMVTAVNSLLETNLGMPLIYLIYLWATRARREDFSLRPECLTLLERMRENVAERVREPKAPAPTAREQSQSDGRGQSQSAAKSPVIRRP